MVNTQKIFNIKTKAEFNALALQTFKHQFKTNMVYKEFCKHLGKNPINVNSIEKIPFIPIDFFKSKIILSDKEKAETIFTSSGTTGSVTSKHYVSNINLYKESYIKAFRYFYGHEEDYCVLALLPSYLERQGSSLIYMVNDLIDKSSHPESGFFLKDTNTLITTLKKLEAAKTKTLLIGVSFALLDLIEETHLNLKNTIVMETGGMKGRRKEMIREELHDTLKNGLGVSKIHSEYGMTELLSQAYSKGDGIFHCPPWMKVLTRDTEDPLSIQEYGKTGGVNVIDLANVNSCSFIATQDLGKIYEDDSFEILGRFDHSDIRGCNLLVL
ncbi:acyl transferase [uncultured Maribacter sp.]|uniref:LuxE/PaaK family acyltransferase n=1 Tax=uncultured Maribacter sp. TaxID=431308 RepID=UPI00262567ED|nr:acyl transferase [uncultured Maribacter sp.]